MWMVTFFSGGVTGLGAFVLFILFCEVYVTCLTSYINLFLYRLLITCTDVSSMTAPAIIGIKLIDDGMPWLSLNYFIIADNWVSF